ncbi:MULTISPECIES: transcriptional regulator [unclassified Acidocella]|uniref:transcriptional regulator n=1 Tax=unclassified Acidocella TaxID=2648610 RepID=UPI00028F0A23|nr:MULTISPECIES: transcriptional regulator [unclassified Acidocella]EKM99373.1 response regulator receiver protein [Acidocella sp. MX-AZ02]WBO58023.1 hypothetical protein GT370_12185 [Acidocella sp. MX-AZ03]
MAESRPLVLVHSDEEPVGQALRFALALEGVEVGLCASGSALLARRDLSLAVCLVLRHAPPQLDGCALAALVRQAGVAARVLLLAPSLSPQMQAQARAAGVWLVLETPVQGDVLVETIVACVPGRRDYVESLKEQTG